MGKKNSFEAVKYLEIFKISTVTFKKKKLAVMHFPGGFIQSKKISMATVELSYSAEKMDR